MEFGGRIEMPKKTLKKEKRIKEPITQPIGRKVLIKARHGGKLIQIELES